MSQRIEPQLIGSQLLGEQSQQSWLDPVLRIKLWIVPFLLSVLLLAVEQYDYLTFHVLAEFFAVIISFILFAVAWQTFEFSKNSFLLFLACTYFWIGALDLVHALTYKGMNLIVKDDSNTATQFWIVTRYMEALFLFAAPFVANKTINQYGVFSFAGLIAVSLAALIFSGTFPILFIEGQGLVPLKVYSEYTIMAILGLAIVALVRRDIPVTRDARTLIIFAIILTIAAEMAFTLYVDLYGIFNVIGHIFKLCSYWVLYQATVAASLTSPYLELQTKHSELQDRQSELHMLSNAINQTPVSILITDASGYIIYANQKFEQITGYRAGEVIGHHPQIFRSKKTPLSEYKVLWETVFSGKQWRGELQNKRKDGTVYWESLVVSPVSEEGGNITHFLSISEDITKRKRMENEVTRFGRIVEQSSNEIYIFDSKTLLFTQANEGARANLGYTLEELRKLTPLDIKPLYDAESFAILVAPLKNGHVDDISITTTHQRKDGSTYDAEVHIQLMQEEAPPVFVANVKDVTRQKRLEEQLRQAQKMEAVGQITGGIAHDFNNILAIILGNLEFLQELIESSPEAEACIEGALAGTTRGVDLTSKLLGFTRQQDRKTVQVNVNSLLQDIEALIAKSLTASVLLEHKFASTLWPVDIDSLDFENAILNLSLNARDAMPQGGTLTIETYNKTLDETYVANTPDAKIGDFVVISVSDTGTGMDKDTQKKALDPFFTTKEPGKGTGLGLSMVFGFIRRSGGHLSLYSETGKGTTLQLFLPKAAQTGTPSSCANDAAPAVPRGTETILVVDDEPALQELAAFRLQQLGYSVHTAGNGPEALDILKNHPDIDMLFSDIVMPGGMDGYQLATSARTQNASLKILLATGFAGKQKVGDISGNVFLMQLADNLLKKPYTKKDLATAIRQTLDTQT